jgi:hypothetical protein
MPLSWNRSPEPATRSRTVLDTSTSLAPAIVAPRAAIWMAMPATSSCGSRSTTRIRPRGRMRVGTFASHYVSRLSDRLEGLRRRMRELQAMARAVADAPSHQVSLTDPDARAMATTGMVGYNVQAVVDAKHHLIIAHEVTNVGHDRSQLANMPRQAREVIGADGLTVLADRGYLDDD